MRASRVAVPMLQLLAEDVELEQLDERGVVDSAPSDIGTTVGVLEQHVLGDVGGHVEPARESPKPPVTVVANGGRHVGNPFAARSCGAPENLLHGGELR